MRRRRSKIQVERSGPWIGVGGLVVVLWLAIGSFVFAPWWGVVLNIALIAPQAVLLKRWATTRPQWCVFIPIVGTAIFVLVAFIGARYWGWSH